MTGNDLSVVESEATTESSIAGRDKASDTAASEEASLSGARGLVQDDSKLIRRSKIFLLLFITLTAVAVSCGVYFLTASAQEDDFETRVRVVPK